MDKRSLLRAFFRFVNRFIVVPLFQRGLGWIVSNRLVGDIMVLGIAGRKTGIIRYTPVSYARMAESVYCYQGKEMKGVWYCNLLANPKIDVLLPNGRFSGYAEEVNDTAERLQAMRMILLGSGLNSSMYGFDPATAEDDVVWERTKEMPVIRIALTFSKPSATLSHRVH